VQKRLMVCIPSKILKEWSVWYWSVWHGR
jgi:hypothetical protein